MADISNDLTTATLLQTYLSTHPSVPHRFTSPTSISILTGGSGNFTYRLHLPNNASVVLKHSTSYVASNNAIPFSIERWRFEKLALESIPSTEHAKVPELYFADEANHVLIMEDAGIDIPTLKQLLGSSTPVSQDLAKEIGTYLAAWLLQLHAWGRSPANLAKFENTTARGMCAWRTFGRIRDSLKALSPPCVLTAEQSTTLNQITASMQKGIMTDNKTVVMGDFWTGNILVKLSSSGPATLEKLYILDYELAHPGSPETDIAQMVAEVYLSGRFATATHQNVEAAKTIESVFVEEYAKGSEEVVDRGMVGVCKGGHIGTWVGMVGWSTDLGKVSEVSGEGMEMVWEGWEKMRK